MLDFIKARIRAMVLSVLGLPENGENLGSVDGYYVYRFDDEGSVNAYNLKFVATTVRPPTVFHKEYATFFYKMSDPVADLVSHWSKLVLNELIERYGSTKLENIEYLHERKSNVPVVANLDIMINSTKVMTDFNNVREHLHRENVDVITNPAWYLINHELGYTEIVEDDTSCTYMAFDLASVQVALSRNIKRSLPAPTTSTHKNLQVYNNVLCAVKHNKVDMCNIPWDLFRVANIALLIWALKNDIHSAVVDLTDYFITWGEF